MRRALCRILGHREDWTHYRCARCRARFVRHSDGLFSVERDQ